MKFKIFPVLVFVVCCLFSSIGFAQNKVVVIPLVEEKIIQCNCKGELSPGGRWCDQGNGTVMDMTNCLVWLKNASWGGGIAFKDCSTIDNDAHTRAGLLKSGDAGLSDGSVEGDWRLPTLTELVHLTQGDEAVLWKTPRSFNGVLVEWYWSSNSTSELPNTAWTVELRTGIVGYTGKGELRYVWPVRSAN